MKASSGVRVLVRNGKPLSKAGAALLREKSAAIGAPIRDPIDWDAARRHLASVREGIFETLRSSGFKTIFFDKDFPPEIVLQIGIRSPDRRKSQSIDIGGAWLSLTPRDIDVIGKFVGELAPTLKIRLTSRTTHYLMYSLRPKFEEFRLKEGPSAQEGEGGRGGPGPANPGGHPLAAPDPTESGTWGKPGDVCERGKADLTAATLCGASPEPASLTE